MITCNQKTDEFDLKECGGEFYLVQYSNDVPDDYESPINSSIVEPHYAAKVELVNNEYKKRICGLDYHWVNT